MKMPAQGRNRKHAGARVMFDTYGLLLHTDAYEGMISGRLI
jgi:hypothetical protein